MAALDYKLLNNELQQLLLVRQPTLEQESRIERICIQLENVPIPNSTTTTYLPYDYYD